MTFFTDILKGIMIGIANIIPGVSGGTMAVSLGIYDKLISSVSNLLKDWRSSVRTLLPLLKLSEDASVVFTSSSVGRKGRAYWGAYGVSKFAAEGLMQTLADEVEGVAPVRANSVNPGATRTGMRAQAYPGENPASNPLPEAIMPVYLYLMGPDSRGVNGQAFDAQ